MFPVLSTFLAILSIADATAYLHGKCAWEAGHTSSCLASHSPGPESAGEDATAALASALKALEADPGAANRRPSSPSHSAGSPVKRDGAARSGSGGAPSSPGAAAGGPSVPYVFGGAVPPRVWQRSLGSLGNGRCDEVS